MARVGDRVKVKIGGGTNLAGTLDIREGSSMSVSGEIIEDLGHSWLVRLSISVEDKNLIVIPKHAEVSR